MSENEESKPRLRTRHMRGPASECPACNPPVEEPLNPDELFLKEGKPFSISDLQTLSHEALGLGIAICAALAGRPGESIRVEALEQEGDRLPLEIVTEPKPQPTPPPAFDVEAYRERLEAQRTWWVDQAERHESRWRATGQLASWSSHHRAENKARGLRYALDVLDQQVQEQPE